ncbi:MAG: hypothetical protein AB1715_11435, partial [Acidobacteriota bacterium]
WDVFQTVTLAAAEDADSANGTAIIRLSATGLASKDVTAVEQDDDADNGSIAPILTPSLSTSGLSVDTAVQISANKNQVSAFGVDLVYDGTFFAYTGYEPGSLTGNWNITVDTATPGKVKVRGIGGTIIPVASAGSLAIISFQVNCLSYTVPTISVLRLENYTDDLFDEFLPLPSTANFTFYPCARLGDVNNDGSVTPGDAQSAFEIYLGKLNPTFCQSMTSDGNCSGTTTPGDAQDIFEHYLGKKNLPLCCAESSSVLVDLAMEASLTALEDTRDFRPERGSRSLERSRSFPDPEERRRGAELRRRVFVLDSIGRPGEIVNIPVLVTNPSGLGSFGFDVLYPGDLLEFLGAEKTVLTQEFDDLFGNEEAPGLVHVEGAAQQAILDNELGALVLLVFRVREGDDLGLPVQVLNPDQDLRDAEIGEGIFLRRQSLLDLPRLVGLGNPVFTAESLCRVPVEVNDLFGLKAFGFELSYSKDKMVFQGIRRPESPEGLIALQGFEAEPGLVRVGGFRMSAVLQREPGQLVELVFRLVGRGGEIALSGFVDDLAKALVTTGKIKIE